MPRASAVFKSQLEQSRVANARYIYSLEGGWDLLCATGRMGMRLALRIQDCCRDGFRTLVAVCARLFRRRNLFAALLVLAPHHVQAGYLDENPEEVFSTVYERLGALPLKAARDPYVWLRLEELKREPCDQKSIGD